MNQERHTAPQSGDAERWFDEFYREHQAAVVGYVARRLPDGVEDVVSETFMTAWRKRHVLPNGYARAWLIKTASHHIMHAKRGAARRKAVQSRAEAHAQGVQPDFAPIIEDAAASQHVVQRAMAQLSDKDRELLTLWAWEELDNTEIAVAMGVSNAYVRTRLSRARKRLAQCVRKIEKQEGKL